MAARACSRRSGCGSSTGNGDAVAPTPAGLATLASADAGGLDPRLGECAITIMSDVNNPLCGERGATAIFGPQKGVRADEIAAIDATLARFAALAERAVGRSAADRPGAGAAGGLGFALQLVGGSFRSGAEVVADLIGLDAALAGADWAITGEGRTDAQTLLRKAPFVVAERARAAGVPITLLSGAIDSAALPELGRVFDGCFALPAGPMTLADCIAHADVLLADRAGRDCASVVGSGRSGDKQEEYPAPPGSVASEQEGTSMNDRPFRILGLQQVAIGGLDKQRLRALWVDTLGLEATGTYRSERENVDEDILARRPRPVQGRGRPDAAARRREEARGPRSGAQPHRAVGGRSRGRGRLADGAGHALHARRHPQGRRRSRRVLHPPEGQRGDARSAARAC